ncbi:oligopeptidase [Cohnella sp. AR92]|uniref:oligopeptidase n=1 Tax=Cohnella sp. AR92 TaxID=648716 RepID=UPI000F8D9267|nr:oligopeptidase [Cohnella sp. AR92]RUS43273.1 oligopeptidase [Cohnella sp. AR92]
MDNQGREPPFQNWMSAPLEGIGPGVPGAYPGLGGDTAATNALIGAPSPTYSPVQVMPPATQPPAASPSKGLLGNFNLGDLKGMLDRMGGVEGLLSNMGKVQKFMSTVQQVAPLLKLFMGKKGSKDDDDSASSAPARRRRRRTSYKPKSRRKGSSRRRRGSSKRRR